MGAIRIFCGMGMGVKALTIFAEKIRELGPKSSFLIEWLVLNEIKLLKIYNL